MKKREVSSSRVFDLKKIPKTFGPHCVLIQEEKWQG
jgi:hypothetical protein